jgi:hypothetical protein
VSGEVIQYLYPLITGYDSQPPRMHPVPGAMASWSYDESGLVRPSSCQGLAWNDGHHRQGLPVAGQPSRRKTSSPRIMPETDDGTPGGA